MILSNITCAFSDIYDFYLVFIKWPLISVHFSLIDLNFMIIVYIPVSLECNAVLCSYLLYNCSSETISFSTQSFVRKKQIETKRKLYVKMKQSQIEQCHEKHFTFLYFLTFTAHCHQLFQWFDFPPLNFSLLSVVNK